MTARATVRRLVFVVAACLTSAPAWALTNKLYLNSHPGDWVGQGQQVTYTAGVFSASGDGTQMIDVSFHTAAYEHWWYLDFSAPQGQVLGPGMYEGATGSPWQSPTHPGLDVYGDGRGCSKLTGRFVVLDASYDSNGNVLSTESDVEKTSPGEWKPPSNNVIICRSALQSRAQNAVPAASKAARSNGSEKSSSGHVQVEADGGLDAEAREG